MYKGRCLSLNIQPCHPIPSCFTLASSQASNQVPGTFSRNHCFSAKNANRPSLQHSTQWPPRVATRPFSTWRRPMPPCGKPPRHRLPHKLLRPQPHPSTTPLKRTLSPASSTQFPKPSVPTATQAPAQGSSSPIRRSHSKESHHDSSKRGSQNVDTRER